MIGFLRSLMFGSRTARGGVLTRLARDKGGNTLAIMAAAMIPLIGLVGSGVDLSRLYIVKTRLQHACDAGALAGRKTMGGGMWDQNNYYPRTEALKFFDANIQTNPYGATSVTRVFNESAGKVTGTATAVVPMTLMRVFNSPTRTLTVNCDAEMRLPNTDVMFVLDTTGSMGSKAVSSDTDTKIESLRKSVKCFFEIVARLDTDATCTTGTPSGGTGNQVQIRFGFVPYSVNVNVGKLLPTSYFPNSWNYQSRVIDSIAYPTNGTPSQTSTNTSWGNAGSWQTRNYSFYKYNASSSYCQSNVPATTTSNGSTTTTQTSATEYPGYRTVTYDEATPLTRTEYRYNTASGNYCYYDTRTTSGTTTNGYTRNDTAQVTWRYGSVPIDISGLKNGTAWNDTFQLRIGDNGTMSTINWNGCIEERATVSGTSFTPIPAGAKDLDIDSVPTGDVTTQWKPALGSIEYARKNGSTYTTSDVTTTGSFSQPDAYCPAEARKLQTWSSASDFDDYVDGLTPNGNTYHDIGLLWGARFLSPTGIFSSENAYTPQGGEIERHLIFMTDGDTQTSTSNYAAYGYPWYDRRNVSSSDVGSSPGSTDMNDEVNARFLALCTAVKNKNITLWVISFGSGSNSTTEGRLEQCATPGRYFTARDSASLQSTFASIANQISQLRLTR